MDTPIIVGREWLIEAAGCEVDALRDPLVLQSLFAEVIDDLGLKTVGEPIWHKFPGEGGVTGLVALSESHLACHTYPEHGLATFNLYSCKDRPEWEWKSRLSETLGAAIVQVTRFTRGIQDKDRVPKLRKIEDQGLKIEMSAAGGEV